MLGKVSFGYIFFTRDYSIATLPRADNFLIEFFLHIYQYYILFIGM